LPDTSQGFVAQVVCRAGSAQHRASTIPFPSRNKIMRANAILRLVIFCVGLHAVETMGSIVVWGNDGVYQREALPTSDPKKIVGDVFTNIVSVSTAHKRLGIVGLEKGSLSNDALGFFVVEREANLSKKVLERRGLLRAALSPDGNRVAYLVCRSESCELLVRQIADATDDAVITPTLSRASQIAWNPNGRQLAVENDAGSVEIVDIATKTKRPVVKGGNPAWSTDGKRLAYVSEKAIWIYDFVQGKASKVYQRHFWQSDVVGLISWAPNDILAVNVAAGIDGKEIECLLLDLGSSKVTVLQRGYFWCGPWLD
jgi:WD40 repeat protein